MNKKYFKIAVLFLYLIAQLCSSVYANNQLNSENAEVSNDETTMNTEKVEENEDHLKSEKMTTTKSIVNVEENEDYLKSEKMTITNSMVNVEEGFYQIIAASNNNKVLEIVNAQTSDNARLGMNNNNTKSYQRFKIKRNNNGYYSIINLNSNLYLEADGTVIKQRSYSRTNAQDWFFVYCGSGYYNLVSRSGGLYITFDGNKELTLRAKNDSNLQKFKLDKKSNLKGKQTIADGYYIIESSIDKNKVIDIENASIKDEANAILWQKNGNNNQKFKFTYDGNGYYTITSVKSKKVLDVAWAKKENESNVQQYTGTGENWQKWIVEKNSDGTYSIISAHNGLYIDLPHGSTKNGTNIQLYMNNGGKNQKFILEKIGNEETKQLDAPPIPDGYYIIGSAIDKNKVIDIENASIKNEANAILWQKNKRNNQKFKFTYDGKGYYTITSVKSKKVLDVAWASKANGSNVQQYTSSGNNWQKWIVEKNSDGTYSIISAHSGLYIDLPYGSTKNGTNIQLYMNNGGKNQKFVLEKTDGVEGTKTIADGYYQIKTKLDTSKVLDIGNFSKSAHTKVAIWSNNIGYNQRFKITYKENGFYSITAVHSKKALDLSSNKTTIEQDDLDGSEEQEWAIKKDSYGLYIVSAHNGLCLDVQARSNGSNINLSKKSNFTNQYFEFSSVNVETGSKTISNGTYQIMTGLDNAKVLDIEGVAKYSGANLELWTNNKGNNQKFNIKYQENGYYKITAVHSGKAIGVEGVGNGSKVDVRQYDASDSSKQDWIIKSCGDGYYNIISACNGLYLNVYGSNAVNGANIEVDTKKNNSAQKFKFEMPFYLEAVSGTYGSSGLKIRGDSRGQSLRYYKIGNGPNVYFATFAVHGWEDLWNYDGQALTKIAEDFKNKLIDMQDKNLANKWTIYIFPSVNPDGEYNGWTHNGPGRTTLFSAAPGGKGIDINRCWSTGYQQYSSDRNYNGTEPFQAYEAQALRDFLLNKKATKGQTILVDLHGWLNETIGDNQIGGYYRSQYGISKHIATYGKGYLVNWARSNLGANGNAARSALVELPEYNTDSSKYINATINMLRTIV